MKCSFVPQMSPIYWLMLMVYFISMMMLLTMIIFFFSLLPSMKNSLMTVNNSMNWMW